MILPATLMTILLALIPIILLTGAIALFNFTTFRAGLATLALLAPAMWGDPAAEPLTVWLRAMPDALILTLTVVYTLFFGLSLYHLMEGSGALGTLLESVALLGPTHRPVM